MGWPGNGDWYSQSHPEKWEQGCAVAVGKGGICKRQKEAEVTENKHEVEGEGRCWL